MTTDDRVEAGQSRFMEVDVMHWRFGPKTHEESMRPAPIDSLIIETERYLDGNYLEIAFGADTASDLPAWVWISVLAHGDERTLERAADWTSDHPGTRPDLATWERVLEHVAQQILTTAVSIGCSTREIQRELLIPLELTINTTPIGPATLYRLLSSMLSELKARAR